MIRRPPRTTRTDTLFPYTTLFRSANPITVGTSDTAIMERGGKRIVMNGSAHVHRQQDANNDALDVRSEQLIILPDDDVVYTDLPAVVVKGNSRMSGTGMRYNKSRSEERRVGKGCGSTGRSRWSPCN